LKATLEELKKAGGRDHMSRTKEEIEAEWRRLKAEYGIPFDQVAEILFRHDPIGINFEDNTDEYYPEVETILPRLKTCQSEEEVAAMIHQEFVRWFDPGTAGRRDSYREIAKEIWQAWLASPLYRV
jgi:hypothetical protein